MKTPTRLQILFKPIFVQQSISSRNFHCMISKKGSGKIVYTKETAPRAQIRLPLNSLFKT